MASSKKYSLYLVCLLLWLVGLPVRATQVADSTLATSEAAIQEYSPTTPDNEYLQNDIEPRPLDWETWDEQRKEMVFDEKEPPPPAPQKQPKQNESKPPKPNNTSSSFNNLNLSSLWQVILILVVITLLGLLVFLIVKQGWLSSNTSIKKDHEAPVALKDIEDRLHETDMEKALRLTLEAKDYRMAIRVYYLTIIKELSAKKWILWKRDKTNGQYVREVANKPNGQAFKQLTVSFDRVWYGNEPIEARHFEALSPSFKSFIDQLKKLP